MSDTDGEIEADDGPHREFVTVADGVVLNVLVGGNGPPLVLLHGFPESHIMWRHVAPELAAYNLLGVPAGWRAYATRGYNANVAEIAAEYELAAQHAGERPLFLVYGGGAAVQSLCLQRGWLWLNEQRNLVHEQQIPPQA